MKKTLNTCSLDLLLRLQRYIEGKVTYSLEINVDGRGETKIENALRRAWALNNKCGVCKLKIELNDPTVQVEFTHYYHLKCFPYSFVIEGEAKFAHEKPMKELWGLRVEP